MNTAPSTDSKKHHGSTTRSNGRIRLRAAALKELRLKRGLSQLGLASLAGVSLGSVRAAEGEGRVSVAIAAALVGALARKGSTP